MTQETIARLRISLNDIEPEIWRTVEMPVAGSLKMLHDVIQAAMAGRTITSGISKRATAATAYLTLSGRTVI